MSSRAAITVDRPPDEVRGLWGDPDWVREHGATVSFAGAPGDRGTEIHVALEQVGLAGRLTGSALAEVKKELRRFKQRVETGEVPVATGEREKAGVA